MWNSLFFFYSVEGDSLTCGFHSAKFSLRASGNLVK